jgi:uncharacterized protein (DUF2252 family)
MESVENHDGPLLKGDAPFGRTARRERGKSLRKDCPRASHADVVLGQGPRDPVSLIELSNGDRVEHLLPVRFGRMSESAFAFFRGTAAIQAHDLKGAPSSGIIVQCCGDCHLMNFGGFATPERKQAFDINDFDETFPAPFEWDVKRLAASFALAARWLEFEPTECRAAAQKVVTAYHENINRYAEMHALEVWYSQITSETLLEQFESDEEFHKRLKKSMEKAAQNTSERVFNKLTCEEGGRVRIVDQPPLLFHDDSSQIDLEQELVPFFESYRETLTADRQVLYDRFRLTDFAYKVVGVGSVGTRCCIALYMADDDDPLFLQVKQARASVLEGLAGPPRWASNGERVVIGQRLMQSASDIFLGWSRGQNGRDFYVRQLRDMKFTAELTGFTPKLLSYYADMCGQVLARAHSKAGDAATIAGYLGDGTSFDEAISQYAVNYADQVEQDFATFQTAVRAGKLPIDTMPAEIEQVLR